ncbi:MAG: hypothetical protein LUC41_04560 [Clostridiales bacterium]|nr:hypothetical protein [Clostridiales bacterium]
MKTTNPKRAGVTETDQEYMQIYYHGGDPMSFRDFTDSMARLAKGEDDEKY